MPMYKYECECGQRVMEQKSVEERDVLPTCRECHKKMFRDFSSSVYEGAQDAGGRFEITLDHAEQNPVSFSSRKSLRSYLKERGLESSALL